MEFRFYFVFIQGLFVAEGFFLATDYKNVTTLKLQNSKCKFIFTTKKVWAAENYTGSSARNSQCCKLPHMASPYEKILLSEYECKSGDCVHEDFICDGKKDCPDGSDEAAFFADNYCPPYMLRCACVNSDAKCDGKKDCKDNSDEALSIYKRQADKPGSCDKYQFQCNDGQCIDYNDYCDGIDNCADGSDESVEICANVECSGFSFKCTYGACINSELRCNGVKDCKDDSDERGCDGKPVIPMPIPPRITPQIPSQVPTGDDCLLPPYPEHGKWALLVPSTLQPGEIVKASSVLIFSCNTNYKLMPNVGLSLCKKNWSIIPTCIKTCPTPPNTTNLIVSCSLDGGSIPCDNPYEGAKATVYCDTLYEDPSVAIKPHRFCNDGNWDYPLPNCEPVCGLTSNEAQKLIIDGNNATKGDFPWHVAIYRNYENICGGSIITPKLVLSAAHCFEITTPKIYFVGAGKYYREYNDTKDDEAQFSNINELIIHEDYNGGHPYEAFDLAILVLENPFKMTKYVLPVCLDVTDYNLSNLIYKKGTVMGWGWTQETGAASDTLKYLEVEYKTKQTCTLPKDFQQFYIPYAHDKLCAGVRNQGRSACKGDSGGSLVFRNDLGRYVLRGIVSVAPRRGPGCDSNEFSLFTSIQYHIQYIEKLISKYRI